MTTATLTLPDLRAYQWPMLLSEAPDDVTVSAPQLGKTVVLGMWLLAGAWEDASAGVTLPSWWTAPTIRMAVQGMEKLCEMAEGAQILRTSRWTPAPQVLLTNGARIEARSWEDSETLFGDTLARIAVDEFGRLTQNAFAALRSRVAETRIKGLGHMRYAGNVGEIGGAAQSIWRAAEKGEHGWSGRTWTWRDRSAAATCECGLNGQGIEIEHASLHDNLCERGSYLRELAGVQSQLGPLHFRQLYGAEWLDWSAFPVYTFDRSIHVTDKVQHQQSLPLDLSCDFNVGPMAWVVGQHRPDEAWALSEIEILGGATTLAACREFLRRYPVETYNPKGKRVLNVYGDATGKSHGTKSTETDYDIIASALRPHWPQIRFNVPASNPPVTDRVNAVNAMMKNAAGDVRYYIHPDCKSLADDYAQVSYKAGTRDIDKREKTRTHFSDADGYRLVAEYAVRTEMVSTGTVVSSDQHYDGGIMTMDF